MNDELKNILDRLPPSDIPAEMCAIASLLICPDRADQVKLRNMLRAEWFFSPDNAALFGAISRMVDSGKAIDSVLLGEHLIDTGTLDEIGGTAYLAEILNRVPSWAHGPYYAARVKEIAIRRAAITVCYKTAAAMYESLTPEEAVSKINATIKGLWRLSQTGSDLKIFSLEETLHEFLASKEQKKPSALLTGINAMDEFSGAFSFGGYTIIAGRPSMGKSTLLRWLLGQWSRCGTRTGLIAVEESRSKIAGNYISSEASLENHVVAYRDWSEIEWATASAAVGRMAGWPWFGVDAAFRLDEVCSAFEMLAMEKKCQVIAVDHIHLIRLDHHMDSDVREKSEISGRLKELAKRFNVVLIALAQLHRPTDRAKIPPAPTLTDLRACGEIEEHCDAALFIHREDYYRRGEPATNECKIGVEKNRNGRTGNCLLRSELQFQRFAEMESQ